MVARVIAISAGNGLGQPAQQALMGCFTLEEMCGEVLGALTSTSSLVMVLGQILAGVLMDVNTSGTDLATVVMAAVAALARLPLFRVVLSKPTDLSMAVFTAD